MICFFMTDEDIANKLHTFSIADKDTIRLSEQRHEMLLQEQLLDYSISVDFDKISHHGFSKMNGASENI